MIKIQKNKNYKTKYFAQEKWSQKNGYVTKSYKLPNEVAEKFKLACIKNGLSQSSVLAQFMQDYSNR